MADGKQSTLSVLLEIGVVGVAWELADTGLE